MNFSCNFDAVKAMLSTIKDNIVAALPFWCKTVLQAIVLSFLIRFCFFIELHFRLQIAIEKLLIVLSGFFYYDLLLMASIFVIAFIPYVFLQKLSPKTNQVIIQGILGLYTITTALLAEYYCEVSRPLDQVVFAYSPQELWSTVIASTQFSFVTIIFLCLYIVAWYGSYRFRKIMKPTVFFSGVMLTLSCTAFALFRCKSIVRSEKGYVLHSDFYLAVNQVLYTYIKITDYTQAEEENVSLESIQNAAQWWWSQNNSRSYYDLQYPFLYKNTDVDILGQFFNTTSDGNCPNFVFIIVEGLGRKLTVDNPKYSFTPFLDSIACQGLFWPNCLSTTERTFGVLPAVFASVPQGRRGFANRRIPMAEHNSLLNDLQDNGYYTSFFYGGCASFSGQENFLRKNHISQIMDISPAESKNTQELLRENHRWGVDDEIMIDSAICRKQKNMQPNPFFDIYLTLTTHEPFVFDGIESYEQIALDLCRTDTSHEANIIRNHKNIYATYLYTDNALRNLFLYYKTRKDFRNTIFVITGDHRMAFVNDGKNHLRKYNVPLIIYSPLLKRPRHMESVVSHYDIAPSLTSYLKKNYSCKFPETTHYLGESLDTTIRFVSKKKQIFMLNNRAIEEWIHDSLYLYNNELYLILPNLDVKWYENEAEKERMKQELAMFQSLSVYTVDNNYLRKPISNKEKTNDN